MVDHYPRFERATRVRLSPISPFQRSFARTNFTAQRRSRPDWRHRSRGIRLTRQDPTRLRLAATKKNKNQTGRCEPARLVHSMARRYLYLDQMIPIRQQRSEGVIRCDRKAIGRVLAKQRDVSCVGPVAHSSGSATPRERDFQSERRRRKVLHDSSNSALKPRRVGI
jgi:hypothetical protein